MNVLLILALCLIAAAFILVMASVQPEGYSQMEFYSDIVITVILLFFLNSWVFK